MHYKEMKALGETLLTLSVSEDSAKDSGGKLIEAISKADATKIICGVNINLVRDTHENGDQGFAILGGIGGSHRELIALKMFVVGAIDEAIDKAKSHESPAAQALSNILAARRSGDDSTGLSGLTDLLKMMTGVAKSGDSEPEFQVNDADEVDCQCTNCTTRREVLSDIDKATKFADEAMKNTKGEGVTEFKPGTMGKSF
jgi:hypothetical protein